MSIISRMRRQKAAWWEFQSNDTYGRGIFKDPVLIDCRWEDEAVEFIDAKGTKTVSRAVVYVDRVMQPRDLLQLADPDDAPDYVDLLAQTEDNPQVDGVGIFEIRGFARLPNLKATEDLLTAYL